MNKRICRSALILITVLLSWNCSKEDNPLTNEEKFSRNLKIETEKSEYFINEDFSSAFAIVTANLTNLSGEIFYAKLGDGYLVGMDHEKLLIAAGNDGYFEKKTSDSWKQLNRGVLFEGSKIIRILPGEKYSLQGTAYIDSNTVGIFRLRINYYRTYGEGTTDTLKDISNNFSILQK